MKPRARQQTSETAKNTPNSNWPTPEVSAVPHPANAIGSGGTFSATGTGMQLRSTIRQVGNPIVSTGTGMALVPGAQGSLHR